jgi:hypothetical protein
VKTAFTICSLPTCDKNKEVVDSRFSIFCMRDIKESNLGFVNPIGNPRYVKG